jgi:hypothetical protein
MRGKAGLAQHLPVKSSVGHVFNHAPVSRKAEALPYILIIYIDVEERNSTKSIWLGMLNINILIIFYANIKEIKVK